MINRNDCNFDVNNYPFLDGNISKGQSYSIFISQLVRLARINTFLTVLFWIVKI